MKRFVYMIGQGSCDNACNYYGTKSHIERMAKMANREWNRYMVREHSYMAKSPHYCAVKTDYAMKRFRDRRSVGWKAWYND